jgi:hypothetical protein
MLTFLIQDAPQNKYRRLEFKPSVKRPAIGNKLLTPSPLHIFHRGHLSALVHEHFLRDTVHPVVVDAPPQQQVG